MLDDPLAAQMALTAMRAEDMFRRLCDAGQQDKADPSFDPALAAAHELVGYISASDALIELDQKLNKKVMRPSGFRVFYGFLARSRANQHQYIAVIRGTGSLLEWLKDAQGLPIPHSASKGHVEMGFSSIYDTMSYRAYSNGQFAGEAVRASKGIAAAVPDGKITIVGHSLGSALATYLALDLATIEHMDDRVTTSMFASPHTGDVGFVDYFDQNVATYTLYNYSRDLVPTVPFALGYAALPRAIKFTPDEAQADIKYDPLLLLDPNNLGCQHHAVCYAAMLDFHGTDWKTLPDIDQSCVACIVGPKGV
ncbi:MAG TPA: lipase family protein [Casimicrobiaceae bacterium]|nr:lipase family protein [Casimicrobiaceae bacterium]